MNADSGRLAAQRRITNINEAPFVPDDRYGAAAPGFTWLPLDYDKKTGDGFFLLRFAPGTRSLPHEHSHGESFLIMEGELRDSDGVVFRAGDFVRYEPGSKHWSVAPEGCLMAVFLRGFNRRLNPGESEA